MAPYPIEEKITTADRVNELNKIIELHLDLLKNIEKILFYIHEIKISRILLQQMNDIFRSLNDSTKARQLQDKIFMLIRPELDNHGRRSVNDILDIIEQRNFTSKTLYESVIDDARREIDSF